VVEIHGGLFQDFAPSVFHVHHVLLLSDLNTGARVDRFAADQIIPFAALAKEESRFIIPQVTDHVQTSAWLANLFRDLTLQETATQFGVTSYGAVGWACAQVRAKLAEDRKFRKRATQVEASIYQQKIWPLSLYFPKD